MNEFAKFVEGLAQSHAAIEALLRKDPARLVAQFGLSDAAQRGLGAADAFFKTELPIS